MEWMDGRNKEEGSRKGKRYGGEKTDVGWQEKIKEKGYREREKDVTKIKRWKDGGERDWRR